MKMYWESGSIVPHFLNLGITCMSVVSFTPRPPYHQRKNNPVPTAYEGGWVPEQVWTRWRREEIPVPAGNRSIVVYQPQHWLIDTVTGYQTVAGF